MTQALKQQGGDRVSARHLFHWPENTILKNGRDAGFEYIFTEHCGS